MSLKERENEISDALCILADWMEKYDYIIDLHNNLRTQIIKFSLWNVKSLSFDKINWQKFLYVKFKMRNVMPNLHIVDRYLAPAIQEFNIAQPIGEGILADVNLLDAGAHIGINTVGQSLRNANLQLRSEPPNPQVNVSPWMNTTIGPDLPRRPLEIGESCSA